MKSFLKQFALISLISSSFALKAQTIVIGGQTNANTETVDTTVIEDNSPVEEVFIPTANVSEVRQRMQKIQQKMTMPVVYNSIVHSFIDFFTYKKPSFTKSMLERKDFYFPTFERYLAKYNMPDELKYLSMIESALNPKIFSRAKAVGLWQFMSFTGRENGLEINQYVDERMSIEKSTDAACRYLRQLYNIFGDWELALAAYNSGPGRVRRAIRKAGNITNYWELHPYLPSDTRAYVPQWTAIIYMMHHADSYGIAPENIENYIPTQSIFIDGYFNVESFSNASGISLDDIQRLNPHILKGYLPASTINFELKIPQDKVAYFNQNKKTILDSASAQPLQDILAQQTYSSNNNETNDNGIIVIGGNNNVSQEKIQDNDDKVTNDKPDEDIKRIRKAKKKIYVVRRGDMLNRIADRFDVEMYDIKAWNHLKSLNVNTGQRLTIFLDDDAPIEVERSLKSAKVAKRNAERNKPKFHLVHHGDTLWSIAQRYGGIPIEKLKKINRMRSNAVKTGQKIKLG